MTNKLKYFGVLSLALVTLGYYSASDVSPAQKVSSDTGASTTASAEHSSKETKEFQVAGLILSE